MTDRIGSPCCRDLPGGTTRHLEQLRARGFALLRQVFPVDTLAALRRAAEACFTRAESGAGGLAEAYRYNTLSRSALVVALQEFGSTVEEVSGPLSVAGLDQLFDGAMGMEVACRMDQSWVRKRFAPSRAPRGYHPNSWHQDGGLGVQFPPVKELAMPPMTQLMTCWIPLHACTGDRPSLEFVGCRLDSLLHFSELDDQMLRDRFDSDDFCAPELQLGDGLVLLGGTLHRTYVTPEMRSDRLSVEYRLFPGIKP